MSKYTTQLRFICEMFSGFSESELPEKSPEEIINAARDQVFNFDFPIYDEELRIPLELKILRHYYTREIGSETVGLWQWRMQSKLMEIMPMYNNLYEAQFAVANANGINNIDVTTHRDYIPRVSTIEEASSSGETKDAYNDTPQGGLRDVESLNYLSDYRDTKNTASGTTQRSQTGQDTEDVHEYGYRGGKTYYELLNELRNNIINIDQLIIMELNDLFMLIY